MAIVCAFCGEEEGGGLFVFSGFHFRKEKREVVQMGLDVVAVAAAAAVVVVVVLHYQTTQRERERRERRERERERERERGERERTVALNHFAHLSVYARLT